MASQVIISVLTAAATQITKDMIVDYKKSNPNPQSPYKNLL